MRKIENGVVPDGIAQWGHQSSDCDIGGALAVVVGVLIDRFVVYLLRATGTYTINIMICNIFYNDSSHCYFNIWLRGKMYL